MSTLTQSRTPLQDGAGAARLLSRPLALTFLAEFSSLTSFFLLLSALPMLAAAAGAGSSAAGLVTGSLLLGTVTAEAFAAAAIRRFGYRAMPASWCWRYCRPPSASGRPRGDGDHAVLRWHQAKARRAPAERRNDAGHATGNRRRPRAGPARPR